MCSLVRVSAPAILMMLLATASARGEAPRLEPCPETPNCVSTQAERADQKMTPIPFTEDLDSARERLVAILEAEPRVSFEVVDERRIDSVFTTRWMRFKDDVVFLFDPEAGVIHFRSASRIGRSDLGANRERMERLTRAFEQAAAKPQ